MPCLNAFLHHCHACGGDALGSIEHMLLECPFWEYHRAKFGTLAPELLNFIRKFTTSPKDITTLLLGGVPFSLKGLMAPFIS
jgi:hypothetical protein